MKSGKLILVRGLPGTGKSTIASRLAVDLGFVHLETDKLFMADGEYDFNVYQIEKYHDMCVDAAHTLKADGWNVVVSNMFTEMWEMERYDFDLIIRTKGICFANTHNVPDRVVASMEERFVDVDAELYAEGRYILCRQEILQRLKKS